MSSYHFDTDYADSITEPTLKSHFIPSRWSRIAYCAFNNGLGAAPPFSIIRLAWCIATNCASRASTSRPSPSSDRQKTKNVTQRAVSHFFVVSEARASHLARVTP